MRVISGKYRGKILNTVDSINTRPTTDRVKENVFNLLDHSFPHDTKVLDIFSGSGAIGIEFASRGASNIYLNDSSKDCINIINKNISNIDANFTITNHDSFSYHESINTVFDYIYIDGPYNNYDLIKLLSSLKNNTNYSTTIIVETDSNYNNDFVDYEILKKKKYGKTLIWILRGK